MVASVSPDIGFSALIRHHGPSLRGRDAAAATPTGADRGGSRPESKGGSATAAVSQSRGDLTTEEQQLVRELQQTDHRVRAHEQAHLAAAANAPAQPSGQDRAVAAQAAQLEQAARQELAEQRREELDQQRRARQVPQLQGNDVLTAGASLSTFV